MMSKIEVMAAGRESAGHASTQKPELSEEDMSKDAFFRQVAEITDAMIARHGNDFAIGRRTPFYCGQLAAVFLK